MHPSVLSLAATLLLLHTVSATSLVLHLASPANLPQPHQLPASTLAVLTTASPNATTTTTSSGSGSDSGTRPVQLTALLSKRSTFSFPAIPAGSYLLDVHCRDLVFAPLRLDVRSAPQDGVRLGWEPDGTLELWQTFRGNGWANKGERLAAGEGNTLEAVIVPVGGRVFWEERGGFNPLSLLSNPMILIGIVGMAVMVGMPKLMENMDPEMREEFEKQQKASPLANGLTSGNPMGGFDMAAWMAGSGRGTEEGAGAAGGGGGGGGGRGGGRGDGKGGGASGDGTRSSGAEAQGGAKARKRG